MNILDSRSIINELYGFGTGALISPMRDVKVACPSIEWLSEFWDKVLKPSIHTWTPEKFDCDDFCYRCVDRATECLVQSGHLSGCGHAVIICYLNIHPDKGGLNGVMDGNHATMLVRTDEKWVFFEPQNGLIRDAEEVIFNEIAKPYFFLL